MRAGLGIAGSVDAPEPRHPGGQAGRHRPRPMPGFHRNGYDRHQLSVLQQNPQRRAGVPAQGRQRGLCLCEAGGF